MLTSLPSATPLEYPNHLLPKPGYKEIATQDLPEPAHVLRISFSENVIDSLGKVRPEAIVSSEATHQILDLSVNLFGEFTLEDMVFRVIDKPLIQDWNEGDDCVDHVGSHQYEIVSKPNPIFFKVKRVHGQSFPYSKPDKKQVDKDFEGTCIILHKPTRCNFWHFQFHFKDVDGHIIKASGTKWKDNLTDFLFRSFIKKFATLEIPEKLELDKRIYAA